MAWTDERVELLTKLYKGGESATLIAKKLGGITRNAVIGKAHRLGLTAASVKPGGRATAKVPRAPRAEQPCRLEPSAPRKIIAGNGAVFDEAEARPPRVVVAFADEGPGLATSLTLRSHMCKWPIGDPGADDFTFCGRQAAGGSYCHDHAALAYQRDTARRPSANELARSLRRYL